MRSSLYEGVVVHRRHATPRTGDVAHGFEQRVTMALLFLDEVDDLFASHPWWTTRSWRPVRFRRSDFLGDLATPLDEAVRTVVHERIGRRLEGPIAVLTNLRTWGWLFSPLSVYYCYDAAGSEIDAVVLEVTSTPWHERHVYVIDGADAHHRFAKEMHVSPFMGMDHDYVVNWTVPNERLTLHLGLRHGSAHDFDAGLDLERRAITRRSMSAVVWRHPLRSYSVSAGIYFQALRLFIKRAPFHPRSKVQTSPDRATPVRSNRP